MVSQEFIDLFSVFFFLLSQEVRGVGVMYRLSRCLHSSLGWLGKFQVVRLTKVEVEVVVQMRLLLLHHSIRDDLHHDFRFCRPPKKIGFSHEE